jgi:ribose 1,5-bisphosphokinase PhnN
LKPDAELDRRLGERGTPPDADVLARRGADREFRHERLVRLENTGTIDEALQAILGAR